MSAAMHSGDQEKPLPRGHAFIHFRNDGYSIKIEFPEKHSAWLDKMIKIVMQSYREYEENTDG